MDDQAYLQIPGWFNFEDVYRDIVAQAQPGAHFVEVGVYCGRSTCFMATEIAKSGKLLVFDAVDIFCDGHLTSPSQKEILNRFGTQLHACRHYLVQANIDHLVTLVALPSVQAASLYADNSLDFIWLDAGHDFASVSADLKAWAPKLKRGGTIGGHDYWNDEQAAQVQAAVDGFFEIEPGSARQGESSWLLRR
jgi:cephalosporin hydroxylase